MQPKDSLEEALDLLTHHDMILPRLKKEHPDRYWEVDLMVMSGGVFAIRARIYEEQ